jgi:signal transduction histidine kinase
MAKSMARARSKRKPTFLWQALLILLPVVVLAVLGLFSLRQDKMLAQHEASERAQLIADDLLPKLWADLTATNLSARPEHQAFLVDSAGGLVFPPPIVALPVPQPFNLAQLTADQLSRWQSAQRAESGETENDAAVAKYREFIASNPPESFAAAASYALGLMQARQQKNTEALDTFDSVLEKYPNAISEAGVPLEPLAELKVLELTTPPIRQAVLRGPLTIQSPRPPAPIPGFPTNTLVARSFVSVDSFCSHVVYRPTLLTPYFLDVAVEKAYTSYSSNNRFNPFQAPLREALKEELEETRQHWLQVWAENEQSRRLFAAAAPHFRTNTGFDERDDAPLFFWFTATNWDSESTSVVGTNRFDSQSQDRDWLALRCGDSPTGNWFVCLSESEVGARLSALVQQAKQIPDYFGVGIELAGKRLTRSVPDLRVWHYYHYRGKGGGVRKEYSIVGGNNELAENILASAKSQEGAGPLKINIYLTSPAALFQRQSARTFWFGSLIAASAAAALVGLLAAWRAFHNQQQLSEMKSNFVSSVSHELRAPIASVRLLAESLERGKIRETPKQHEYFRFIGQECRRLSSLIENVLDFSRIEQGRKQYDFEPTDLVALTQQTVKMMDTYAAEKQVSLSLDLSHLQPANGTLELFIDGRAIQQAVVNLIDNAIKHSPKGQTVTIVLENHGGSPQVAGADSRITSILRSAAMEDGHHASSLPSLPATHHPSFVTLCVEDRGPGIPPEEHEKIFERFYRRGSELRRETQGVGIGLSIVKHIVEAHGGKVLVQSTPGEGSRFTIELPFPAMKEII